MRSNITLPAEHKSRPSVVGSILCLTGELRSTLHFYGVTLLVLSIAQLLPSGLSKIERTAIGAPGSPGATP